MKICPLSYRSQKYSSHQSQTAKNGTLGTSSVPHLYKEGQNLLTHFVPYHTDVKKTGPTGPHSGHFGTPGTGFAHTYTKRDRKRQHAVSAAARKRRTISVVLDAGNACREICALCSRCKKSNASHGCDTIPWSRKRIYERQQKRHHQNATRFGRRNRSN